MLWTNTGGRSAIGSSSRRIFGLWFRRHQARSWNYIRWIWPTAGCPFSWYILVGFEIYNFVNLFLNFNLNSSKGKLFLTWYVVATHKDIADFYINIRDKDNTILIEQHVPYDRRTHEIRGKDISPDFSDPLQLCVQAKNSDGSIGSWFDTQCQNLPKTFEEVKNRYDENGSGVFTIISSRTQRNKMDAKARSNSGRLLSLSRIIAMVVLSVRFIF